ncbi:MAG TPA: glycosyltransferase family 2 protein [Candidatus Dormibacteraeota bacterium]|nr:glycosyltransferase family 2 protein [Candidatus Dormibacteraeota bacterium]
MARVHVVILNWNGAPDTLACLDSIARQKSPDLRVAVVDNGSSDDSVGRIREWARQHDGSPVVEVIEAGENLGFAAGSNLGIRHALDAGAEMVLLLNNDTLLEPDVVGVLARFLEDHPDFGAATGQIRYADRPVIWNCGGDLTWLGSRKYLYGEQPVDAVPKSGWRRISFITGCAVLMRASTLREHGLYTERFFFGEEDYELSLRLKRAGVPLATCFDAVITHRVGSSIDRAAPAAALGRYYIYYLNRFIDMRAYYPRPFWLVWRLASLAMVVPRLHRSRGFSWRALSTLSRKLLRDSARLEGVTKERFETATRNGVEAV